MNLTKRELKNNEMFYQKVSNFVDDVEKIQLSRRSQKRREDGCNKVRLQSAKKKSLDNAGGREAWYSGSIPSAHTMLGKDQQDYHYPYRRRKHQNSLK